MAAPMRDGPPEGHRPRAEQPNNFEYDDNEWDIGIGDLIIDLDADIEKTDVGTAGGMASAAAGPAKAATKLADHSATLDKGLKMKIKRTKPGTKTSEAKHEIVKSNELNGNAETVSENTTPVATSAVTAPGPPSAAGAPPRRASAAHRRDKKHVSSTNTPEVNGVTPTTASPVPSSPATGSPAEAPQAPPAPPEVARTRPPLPLTPAASPPPAKKTKTEPKECADVCVGTSVGTITEPDCLGPCEPGTSVTLEGIVWHETEGGVLVVNVTWRGKTYVGTLLDCTRHDWAPPRFCDSPTEELDARTPKGRAKRGRGAIPGGDLSNFTETRSSVHSKLRNGGPKGRRGAATNNTSGSTPTQPTREAPSPPASARASPSPAPSPAPPAPPGKRKTRGPDEESPAGKRRPPASPPASPALLECPEPNCSKKYKHINGLKYHQSHAHGAIDEDESKDNASLSENEESNVEAPSPTDPVKSPEKPQKPGTPKKEERQETLTPAATPVPSPAETQRIPRAPSPTSIPSPATSGANQTVQPIGNQAVPTSAPSTPNSVDVKPTTAKPSVLRFGPQEDFPVANFISKPPTPSAAVVAPVPGNVPPGSVRPTDNVPRQFSVLSQGLPQQGPPQGPPPQHGQPMSVLPIPNHIQHPVPQNTQLESPLPQNIGPPNQLKGPPPSTQNSQFKVKPTAALMPSDDKKLQDGVPNKPIPQQVQQQPPQIPTQVLAQVQNQPQNFKKNKPPGSRKSPGGSPSPDRPFGIEPPSRDEVQSPAYSDISDDNAPESEVDKAKLGDKKPDGAPLSHGIPPGYGMYPFFGQNPYLVPSVQNPNLTDPNKLKDDPNKSLDGKPLNDKDLKRDLPPDLSSQKMLSHYYPYGYIPPGYPYNLDPNYGPVSMIPDDKLKEQEQRERERNKETPSPAEHNKPPPASPQQQNMLGGQVKPKQPELIKDAKHPNENHQILKESIEIKNQMNPYLYQRHHQPQHISQQQAQQQAQHQAQQQAHQAHQQAQHQAHQREEEMRRFYMSMEHQRRKEGVIGPDLGKPNMPPQSQIQNKPQNPNPGNLSKQPPPKDCKPPEDIAKALVKEEPKAIKQEGQKPTMETTGPPPPPTSQFYLHPSYMPPPHYGGLPFDPMYRGLNPMIVSSPYGPGPYLHPSAMPRYHAPEDLSRPPPPPAKALDILQHHASQYYSSHKIHELQERALKSPTPKAPSAGGSPGGSLPGGSSGGPPPPTSKAQPPPPSSTGEPTPNKDSRSPPPQRHVHTHHHTHVGLGYPLYSAPYGAAAVLASQQAAAVTVVNNFPPK